MQKVVWIVLLTVNLAAFLLYGLDKYRAVHKKWRISEAVLLGIAFCGGSVGSLLGMYLFHHKTRKSIFRIGIPAALILQAVFLAAAVFRI